MNFAAGQSPLANYAGILSRNPKVKNAIEEIDDLLSNKSMPLVSAEIDRIAATINAMYRSEEVSAKKLVSIIEAYLYDAMKEVAEEVASQIEGAEEAQQERSRRYGSLEPGETDWPLPPQFPYPEAAE